MLTPKVVSWVYLDDVLKELGFREQHQLEVILECGFRNVSFGDSDLTLLGNNIALIYILDGVDYLDEDIDTEHIRVMYWETVPKESYVNIEGDY
jgi:hypothetical protein